MNVHFVGAAITAHAASQAPLGAATLSLSPHDRGRQGKITPLGAGHVTHARHALELEEEGMVGRAAAALTGRTACRE